VSDTYTKLFSSITESTLWSEPYATRVVWVAMLAMADARGNVYASLPGLARRANVTLEEVEYAIASFLAPDPYSRTKDKDGRRVEMIDGGWHLINHGKHGAVRNAKERAEYKRAWDREHRPSGHQRATQSDSPTTVRQSPTSPTPSTPTPTPALEDQELTPPDGGVVAGKPATPDCPHAEIVALYHEILPELRQVKTWTTSRQSLLRARWREDAGRQDLDWWRRFFTYVRGCPFLMGDSTSTDGRDPFTADLEWLIRPQNLPKVMEGKYQRRGE
jgi:hypothetical protein